MDPDDPDGHVGYASFGYIEEGQVTEFDRLLKNLPAVRQVIADRLTRVAYQTQFGIFDHSKPHNRPLAVVAYHPKEDMLEGSRWFSHIRKYYQFRIGKLFSMSLDEFFAQPPFIVELLYDISKSDAIVHDKTRSDVERQMNIEFDE